MAAASAVKDEPSETGHGENQNNLPLKVEGNQDCFKTVEKPGLLVEGGKASDKCEKAEQPPKKFVDAPLPATNAWTKRSSSLTVAAETNQVPQVPEIKKEAPLNNKAAPQVNAVVQKAGKFNKAPAANIDSLKNEKPKAEGVKIEKPKAEGVKEKPKAEGMRNEKPKAEGVKEKPKAEGVKEKPKAEGVKEKPKAEGMRNEKPKAEGVKNEKLKAHKSKTELNGNKQTDNNNQKPKIKKFGEDYVEAPLPTVNPWKRPSGLTLSSGPVTPVSVELDPTPAAAAVTAVVVSPSSNTKDFWAVEKPFQTDAKKDPNPPERQVSNEAEPTQATSPAVVDDSWPALHEVKVTEPNQTMPPKATKSPRVKASAAASTTTTVADAATPGATPVVSGIASAPVVTIVELSSSPNGQMINDPVDAQTPQSHTHTDSGGDDSSKENKESTSNDDDTSNAVRTKKGTKPKWQRMEIEHPKPDRRHRRSRSQGRGFSPPRRGGRPAAGERFNRPNSRRSEAGPDSQNWRSNMLPQPMPIDPSNTDTVTESTMAADPTQAIVNNMDHVRGVPSMNFTGNRNTRGRGSFRGNGLRRGGSSRGRVAVRDTKSPPFPATANIWANEQIFSAPDQETVQVPWSQGFNRIHNVPRVPPLNQVVLGMEANLYLQEQLLSLLGTSVYYDMASNTYPQPNTYPQANTYPQPSAYPQHPQPNAYPQHPQPNAYPQHPQPNAYPQHPQPNAYPQHPQPNAYPQHPHPPPAPTPQPARPNSLTQQVEYYFSEDNLVKDHYLRKKMDKQGWVALDLVLGFNKVKQMKADYISLKQAIRCSDKLELSEQEDYVRTLNFPDSWPLEPDFTSLPSPTEAERVAAMSRLNSDAPEFVPGQPFVLRNLARIAAESIPVMNEGDDILPNDDVLPNSGLQTPPEEEEDRLEYAASSSLASIPPMLSPR